jgi:hypothetical protein
MSLPAFATNVSFTNINVGNITPGSGHVGVDIWWPDHGVNAYNPCHNSQDIYYGACAMSNTQQVSYYKVMHFTPDSRDFPSGIFIDNQNPNYCTTASWCINPTATTTNHGWANLVTGAAIEIYPYNSSNVYSPDNSTPGGLRIQVNNFSNFANGGRYSANVGNVSLPQLGQSGVGKLNGFATVGGQPAPAGHFNLDIFQNGSTRYTSTNYPTQGFSSIPNNGSGYYNSGALPSGTYQMFATYHYPDQDGNDHVVAKYHYNNVSINTDYERLDFNLNQGCFGQANLSCTRLQ